ncbi:manganese efflux pump [Rodentibacter caecimuris]|uniref:manganese efflux pump n=1 Tax=Rodentibacter caecimuris TaxID=1796644 RepID=UPI0009844075
MLSLRCALPLYLCFGLLRGIMPIIDYLIRRQFGELIQDWDHWFAFTYYWFISFHIIHEGFNSGNYPKRETSP